MTKTGAQIIIEVLCEQGVDTVFGYPGGYVINIYDELYKNADRVSSIVTCHEQGAAHAADGYARASGKPGVVIATSGPGATNLVTGIACAYFDSTPMVAITGNVPVNMLGRDSFQEIDITGVTMPMTKHNYMVKDVRDLAGTLREAFQVAISGRPGPVLVDIPKDVQISSCEYMKKDRMLPRPFPAVREADVDKAADAIRTSRRPCIYSGGGVVGAGAEQELMSLADLIDAPICASMMGLTALPHDHPRFLGMMGMHGRYAATKAMSECDLLIAVGVRFSDRATGDKFKFSNGKTVLHIDIDAAEISKNIGAQQEILGDVKQVLMMLESRIEKTARPEWADHIRELKEGRDNNIDMEPGLLQPQYIIEGVSARMDSLDLVATDVGQHQMWTMLYYRFRSPRTLMTSGGLGAMGFGMGAAIGSCLAKGRRRTVLFTSDGSFHMNMNEVATAVSQDIPLIVIVLNNNALGMVRQWQTLFFEGRYAGTTLDRKTDYVKLAESFGARGGRAATREEFDRCLEEAFSTPGPYVMDCVISSDQKVLPMIPAGKGIDDIILRS